MTTSHTVQTFALGYFPVRPRPSYTLGAARFVSLPSRFRRHLVHASFEPETARVSALAANRCSAPRAWRDSFGTTNPGRS